VATLSYEQVFKNERESSLEVKYVLPLLSNITLTRLRMKLGDKEIECDIMEKAAAKQQFEDAQARQQTSAIAALKDDDSKVLEVLIGQLKP